MFSGFKKALPQISIFHSPTSPPSTKALALLRSSLSSPYPPSDSGARPLQFDLEVIESTPPTADQIKTILSYLPGTASPSKFLSSHPSGGDETSDSAAGVAKITSKNLNALKWPVVVDWSGGRASVGDVEGVKSILEEIRKLRDGESKGDEEHKPKGWFS